MTAFLNQEICDDFRTTINSSKIFKEDEKFKNLFNLSCVVMDRLDTSIKYLNNHDLIPRTETELMIFIMYAAIVKDATKLILEELEVENVYSDENNMKSREYFKMIQIKAPFVVELDNDDLVTDDKFFEYIRSLTMAHPFNTNRQKFIGKKEIHYSPFVIPNNDITNLFDEPASIGLRIYSNKADTIKDLLFPFDVLRGYVRSRLSLLNLATDKLKSLISIAEAEWRRVKVDRELSPVDTLKNISEIMELRHEDTSDFIQLIKVLEYQTDDTLNNKSIDFLKAHIIKIIPTISDYVDDLNYDELYNEVLSDINNCRPKEMHKGAHYQLEKIFGYLFDESADNNIEWGLAQARLFAEGFAKEWVHIDVDIMSFDEIKLLVHLACFMENEEQKKH